MALNIGEFRFTIHTYREQKGCFKKVSLTSLNQMLNLICNLIHKDVLQAKQSPEFNSQFNIFIKELSSKE